MKQAPPPVPPAPAADGGLRPEIQALRAIAAAMVVLYHLWPGRVTGGYAGVDVFFVISGFLITHHLAREMTETGRVCLRRFWARRARRLLPAAYTVIVVAGAAVLIWVPEPQWRQNFREMVAASAYFENWQLAHDSVSYLAASNAPSAVQHYWTLSVEEQFYLCWPLLLMGTWALAGRGRRPTRAALVLFVTVATIASLAYCIWITRTAPSAAYFVTPARVWEFGCGALLALLFPVQPASGRGDAPRSVLSWIGIGALTVAAFGYDEHTSFPGYAAILPVLGAGLIILAGAPRHCLSPMPVLRLSVVQWLGEISYATYLWHWPLLIIVPSVVGHPLGLSGRIAVLGSTLLLAQLSTRYVEKPFRTARWSAHARPGWVLVAAGIAASALALTGISAVDATSRRQAAEEDAAIATVASHPRCLGAASMDRAHRCHNPALDHIVVPAPAAASADVPDEPGCFDDYDQDVLLHCSFGDLSDPSVPHVALIGDSHAQMYLPSLARLAKEGKLAVTAQLKAACPWELLPPARAQQDGASCATFRTRVEGWLARQAPRLDLVVTTARMDNMNGAPAQRSSDLAAAWDRAHRLGLPVVGIVDDPFRPDDPLNCIATADIGHLTPRTCSAPRAAVLQTYDPTRDAARQAADGHVADLTDLFCGPKRCPAVAGGTLIYRDVSHLTGTYALTLTPYLYRALKATGVLRHQR